MEEKKEEEMEEVEKEEEEEDDARASLDTGWESLFVDARLRSIGPP